MAEQQTASERARDINKKVGVGAGMLAAAAGAAAAYYYFGSKDADKHRKKTAKWALDLKKEVTRRAEKLKSIDRESIIGVVDDVARAYENVRGLNRADIMKAAHELRSHWSHLRDELRDREIMLMSPKKTAGKVVKVVKKAAGKSRAAKMTKTARTKAKKKSRSSKR